MKTVEMLPVKSLFWISLAAIVAGLSLAACGGGGSGATASVVPVTPGGGGGPTLPPACSTTSGPLTLSFTASRLSGVAPLAVFFDASASSTTTLNSRPFHDLEYRWAFDSTGVTPTTFWSTGSRPGTSARNVATGPIAAHVFDTPGTYTIALSITDGTNTVTSNCATITVQAANAAYSGTATTCVSSNSLPVAGVGGCPAGADVAQQPDFDLALASFFGAGKRVVFKGGDTFTASATTTFAGTGPAEIGAYGTGRPIVKWSGGASTSGVIRVGGTASDFRINGIEFDGENQNGVFFMSFQNTAWTNLLLHNNYIHGWGGYIQPDWAGSGGFGLFVVGNRFEDPAAGMTTDLLLAGNGPLVAVVGNTFIMNSFGQQVVRMNAINKYVISNNTTSGAAATKETIAMRSSNTVASIQGIVSDNSISVGPGYTGVYPSSASANLGVFDVIIERNHIFGVGGSGAINNNAERVTIRNNIIDMSDPALNFGITLHGTNGGASRPSKDVVVYNNSVFSSKAAGTITGILVEADVDTGSVVRNNLVYTSIITGTVISDAGSKAVKSNNTGDPEAIPGVVTLNPDWTITVPMTPLTNFRPGPASYAIDKGAIVPVFSDFFAAPRTGSYDLGAVNP